jgi:DNA-binding transcriptional regulator YhcF (GntR family)
MQQQQNVTVDELIATAYHPDGDDETVYRNLLREELAKNWAGGFCRMPDLVRQDRTLSPKAKIIYEQLLSYMWFQSDHCWPSQQTLADATGYSRRTVIRACKELYERGYIEKWRRGQGYTNYYFINPLIFPRSFRRMSREPVESMILDVHAPALRENITNCPPRSIDEALALCHVVISRSDNVSHPEVTTCHPNQRSGKQIQGKEMDSNDSTAPQKGRDFPVVTQATRNEQQHEENKHTQVFVQGEQAARRDKNEPVAPSSKKPNHPSSSSSQGTGPASAIHVYNAKYDKIAQKQTKQAAIAQATGIPENHLEEMGIATTPAKRPIPEFIRDIVSRYSRELGDSSTSIKSNITRAAKLYFFALDYIRDAQDDPQGFFSDLLYTAKQAAYKVNAIRYRNAGNRPNRIPVFFTCLENLFELRDEELVYIRSDEPLFEQAW